MGSAMFVRSEFMRPRPSLSPWRRRRGTTLIRAYGDNAAAFNGLAAVAVALLGLVALATAPANAPAAAAEPVVIVALGDSLTAGFGVAEADAFPQQLEAALANSGIAARVINAGVSGDTTAGGRARLDWVLPDAPDLLPDLVIVELGANDGLRGLDPRATKANLDDILGRLAARGIKALLTGMFAPPNLGPQYGAEFNDAFPALAEAHGVVFYPFFLAGVAARPALNQADGIHPNPRGVRVIVEGITPYVARALADDDAGP